MDVKLIPVIELFRSSTEVEIPPKGPYWQYPDVWEEYHSMSIQSSGFSRLESYTKGSGFYELSKLNDDDLLLQIQYRTEGWEVDEICPFDGGYILNVDGEDLLYPQCCSDLGDIESWILASKGDYKLMWQGHPSPIIEDSGDNLVFDLSTDELSESFVPTPLKIKFEIDKSALKQTIDKLVPQLKQVADRLNKINSKKNLGFDNLGELLIWGGI